MIERDPREERNKATLVRLLESMDSGNLNITRELYSPDYVDHSDSGTRGRQTGVAHLNKVFHQLHQAFPDTSHTIHMMVAEGDLVAARVSATGTHTGTFAGTPATGKRVVLTSTAIYRFVDGRIVERWCDNPPSVAGALASLMDEDPG